MDKKINFDNTKIEKETFNKYKKTILINSLDINKIVVFNKISFNKKAFKYFIGYKDASAYRTNFHDTKYMSFFINDDELLEKCNKIWEKAKDTIQKIFDSEKYVTKNI